MRGRCICCCGGGVCCGGGGVGGVGDNGVGSGGSNVDVGGRVDCWSVNGFPGTPTAQSFNDK